jgi:hypothetical protein
LALAREQPMIFRVYRKKFYENLDVFSGMWYLIPIRQ